MVINQTKNILKTSILFIILSFLVLPLFIGTTKSHAVNMLNPGDIFILSANTDDGFNGGPNSNGFEFVTTVDLDPGTQIYFTNKGWDGSLGSPFWRNTTDEGALRYTVPMSGISAGTMVRYDDTLIPALPTSGAATWDMYSIDPVTGAMTLATSALNSFDPATSGDNILIFQGTGASPIFLFGLGFATSTPWISSGAPGANSSWIPASLSDGAGTIVTLGTQDNYQYDCTTIGVFSSGFVSSIQTLSDWNVDNDTPFGPMSGCMLDTSRPTASITQDIGQNDPSNNSSVSFIVTFNQSIDPLSFTMADIMVSGSGSGSVSSISTSDNVTWVVNIAATSEGTIDISLPEGTVIDPNGNPNTTSIEVDNSVLYDITPPSVGMPDMISGTDSGSSNSDNLTNDTTPTFEGICTDGTSIELFVDGVMISPTYICSAGVYSITPIFTLAEGHRNILAYATDDAGNTSPASSALDIIIDTIPPSCDLSSLQGFDVNPELSGYTDDPDAIISLIIAGNNYVAVNNSGNWKVSAGMISPDLAAGLTYPIALTCLDVTGNSNINNSNSYEVLLHVDLAVNVQLLNTGAILPGDNAIYRINLINTDYVNSVDATGIYFYNLVPVELLSPVSIMDTFTTSNPNIQCLYVGEATTIGSPFWTQYAGNNVFRCGFISSTTLSPNQTISFDLSFTTGTEITDGLTYGVLIYDENGYDSDSEILDQAAQIGDDAYGLMINNVSRAVYSKIAFSKPVTPITPIQQSSNIKLASTGVQFLLPVVVSMILLSIAIIIAIKSKNHFSL